jgi:hypothetical protein
MGAYVFSRHTPPPSKRRMAEERGHLSSADRRTERTVCGTEEREVIRAPLQVIEPRVLRVASCLRSLCIFCTGAVVEMGTVASAARDGT